MPLQNRITPFGEIIADPARGGLMGNRGGRIHDPATRTLTNRRWASKQWIACQLAFKDRHRPVMGEGYTELFFLDEATALAAGHRPCFECRRKDALSFAQCWAAAEGLHRRPRAPEMDAILHAERLNGRNKRLHYGRCETLPAGVVVAIEDNPFVMTDDGMRLWAPDAYGPALKKVSGNVVILTPPAIINVLRAGYKISSMN